jgi:asparagine synthase (glutamine-hydrolysing)
MQVQSNRPIKSFSIGFAEAEYDEAPYARKIAAHLGTDHTELYVEPRHALDIIPKIPQWFDEPFADSSQIPTYLVCELTRKHVTVALSGDGGDELFAGYNRYALGAQIWNRTQFFPEFLRTAVGANLRRIPESSFDKLAKLLPSSRRPNLFGHKVHKLADGLLRSDPDAMYRQLVTHWPDPDDIVIGASEPQGHLWNPDYQNTIPEFTERMQFLDTLTYLPDDILTKVDRASMAVSLEARVPLIDHRVVEFAWQLPLHLKIHRGRSKILLRRVLDRYVPREMTDRPKMGFGVPIDLWLRDSLRDWAESLLDERRLREQGLLDPEPIREKWRAHLAGENWAYPLWDVLMLQAWLDHYHL